MWGAHGVRGFQKCGVPQGYKGAPGSSGSGYAPKYGGSHRIWRYWGAHRGERCPVDCMILRLRGPKSMGCPQESENTLGGLWECPRAGGVPKTW